MAIDKYDSYYSRKIAVEVISNHKFLQSALIASSNCVYRIGENFP